MEFQTFLWMMLVGVFASTVVIVLVFIIVNTCMRRNCKSAKNAETSNNPTNSKYELSNTYKPDVQEAIRPPLPPRAQIDTESLSNSYEDMPEIPVVDVKTSSLQNLDHRLHPDTLTNFLDNSSVSESYDDVDALQNVQGNNEDAASLPDYLEVDPADDSENYDDIDQLHEDEDYDDVE